MYSRFLSAAFLSIFTVAAAAQTTPSMPKIPFPCHPRRPPRRRRRPSRSRRPASCPARRSPPCAASPAAEPNDAPADVTTPPQGVPETSTSCPQGLPQQGTAAPQGVPLKAMPAGASMPGTPGAPYGAPQGVDPGDGAPTWGIPAAAAPTRAAAQDPQRVAGRRRRPGRAGSRRCHRTRSMDGKLQYPGVLSVVELGTTPVPLRQRERLGLDVLILDLKDTRLGPTAALAECDVADHGLERRVGGLIRELHLHQQAGACDRLLDEARQALALLCLTSATPGPQIRRGFGRASSRARSREAGRGGDRRPRRR